MTTGGWEVCDVLIFFVFKSGKRGADSAEQACKNYMECIASGDISGLIEVMFPKEMETQVEEYIKERYNMSLKDYMDTYYQKNNSNPEIKDVTVETRRIMEVSGLRDLEREFQSSVGATITIEEGMKMRILFKVKGYYDYTDHDDFDDEKELVTCFKVDGKWYVWG